MQRNTKPEAEHLRMKEPLVAVVTGPTASGKTALAIRLAEHYGSEIISADSRQIFKDIPIGTAAPSPEERDRVVHHLVGIKPLDAYYSAACFESDALAILPSIWAKSPVAIVCGGSMLYIDALLRGIDEMPTVSEATRSYVLRLYEQQGPDAILAQLEIVDPIYYASADRNNTRRIIHALEVSLEAGVPYSSLCTGKAKQRPFRAVKMAIDMPRRMLFDRINARVDVMVAQGLEDEARRAFALGDFNSLNTVGYKEMRACFNGEMTRETAIARIAKNTRVYAKKQLTWMQRDSSIRLLAPANAFEQACGIIDNLTNNELSNAD